MSDVNAVMALKNAWKGVVTTSEHVRAAGIGVEGLPEDTSLKSLDLDAYHRLTFAQANAVLALRGLIEQLQRQAAAE